MSAPLPGADRIEELRAQLDAVDDAILAAVTRRHALVGELRAHKAQRGMPFLDPSREAVIEARYQAVLPELRPDVVRALARAVLAASR